MNALVAALILLGLPNPAETLVKTEDEFHEAVRLAQPGDIIVMANGVWQDAHLVFDADGLEGDSITVRAQSPGRVILTGTSRLRIGGQYLKVEGLWFHRGALTGSHVIQFRTGRPAHHSRLTNCAVTEYNPANWLVQYKWVSLYGTHNRVDHCYLAGKTHDGATLVVWLEDPPNDQPNYHRIDHNHFGWRPVLGKNGGETIRIGTSSRSMQDSFSLVEFNLFHRTNGEHEIISNKSGHNTYRYNTFLEAQGALTLRHGNHATITQNYFLGREQPGTGGVRIIGEDHTVTHNYFANLEGDSSRAALSIMNGIPDSPLNRYFQVKRPIITRNTFINTRSTILYGLGADEEKTLLPNDVLITGNLISTTSQRPVVTAQVSTDNISWQDNLIFGSTLGVAASAGIDWRQAPMTQGPDGLMHSASGEMGAKMDFPPLTESDVGPSWWAQPWTPTVLSDTSKTLPDFSYAGYHWGERSLPNHPVTFRVTDFGATGHDMNDDTHAFQLALDSAHARTGLVVIGIPSGVFHLSGILNLERDSLVLRGSGQGSTKLYVEKPLGAIDVPEDLLGATDSVLVRGRPVSPFTQAGGLIWSRLPDRPNGLPSATVLDFQESGHMIRVSDPASINAPSEAHIDMGNRGLLQVSVVAKDGDTIYTKQPLPSGLTGTRITPVNLLTEVGVEHLTIEFERVPYSGHQLEDGYNSIYMTQVQHGWIRDVEIINADAGIILNQSAQLSLRNVRITGRKSHSGLNLISTWRTMTQDLEVESDAIHPVGIQGASGFNVVTSSRLDHVFDLSFSFPNLYDDLDMEPSNASRTLWTTDTTTPVLVWNAHVRYAEPNSIRLPAYAGALGPEAMIVGVTSTVPMRLQAPASAWLEGINRLGLTVPSLYDLQLRQRLENVPE